jgi:regulator of PEP synthase PpsR (kinase-PPPase family)
VQGKTGYPGRGPAVAVIVRTLHSHSQDTLPMATASGSYFHLHMISDSTGETLITVARAVAAQYANVTAVEHVYPLVRSQKQLDRVLAEIEESPGVVLFTLLEKDLVERLEAKCQEMNIPSLSIIGPLMQLFEAYLGAATAGRVGAQHTLNAEYFKRIDALNYTMMHDDGQHVEGLEDADVVLVGVSRTSKTPTSIYLANRGIRTANVPLVLGIPVPPQLEALTKPLVVSLQATPERLIQVRQNRLLAIGSPDNEAYIDREAVTDEVTYARRLSIRHGWPLLDVTRRSIEETAAAIMKLYADRQRPRSLA